MIKIEDCYIDIRDILCIIPYKEGNDAGIKSRIVIRGHNYHINSVLTPDQIYEIIKRAKGNDKND